MISALCSIQLPVESTCILFLWVSNFKLVWKTRIKTLLKETVFLRTYNTALARCIRTARKTAMLAQLGSELEFMYAWVLCTRQHCDFFYSKILAPPPVWFQVAFKLKNKGNTDQRNVRTRDSNRNLQVSHPPARLTSHLECDESEKNRRFPLSNSAHNLKGGGVWEWN